MPLWFSPSPDYPLLARCQETIRAEMLAARWVGGQARFDEVMRRRAWKLHNRYINRSR